MHYWLRRDDGQQLVIVALLMPVLIAFVGLVIDLGMVYVHHQEAQSAADAAITAAVTTFRLGSGDCSKRDVQAFTDANATVLAYLTKNHFAGQVTYFGCPQNGMYSSADKQYLQIKLSYPYTPIFISVIWSGTFQVTAQATGGYQSSIGNHLLIALDTGAATNLTDYKVHVSVTGGDVYLNSSTPDLIDIQAPAVYLHGTDTIHNGCTSPLSGVCVTHENAPVLADPLKGHLSKPSYTDPTRCPVRSGPYTNPLGPGYYPSAPILPSGTPWVFNATGHTGPSDCDGAFVINGSLTGNNDLRIIGGMLYFPPTVPNFSGIVIGGNNQMTGSPATTGKYAGILVWIDGYNGDGSDAGSRGNLDIRGTAAGALAGIIYAPKSGFSLKGNSDPSVYDSLNVIVDNLYNNGDTYFGLQDYQGPISPDVKIDGQVE
jgi:Flp pilus assembly protein TadG